MYFFKLNAQGFKGVENDVYRPFSKANRLFFAYINLKHQFVSTIWEGRSSWYYNFPDCSCLSDLHSMKVNHMSMVVFSDRNILVNTNCYCFSCQVMSDSFVIPWTVAPPGSSIQQIQVKWCKYHVSFSVLSTDDLNRSIVLENNAGP